MFWLTYDIFKEINIWYLQTMLANVIITPKDGVKYEKGKFKNGFRTNSYIRKRFCRSQT